MEAQAQTKPFDKYADATAMQAQCARLAPMIMDLSTVSLKGADGQLLPAAPLVKKVEQGCRGQDDLAVAWLHFEKREHIYIFKDVVAALVKPSAEADEVPYRSTASERAALGFLNSGKIVYYHQAPKAA